MVALISCFDITYFSPVLTDSEVAIDMEMKSSSAAIGDRKWQEAEDLTFRPLTVGLLQRQRYTDPRQEL